MRKHSGLSCILYATTAFALVSFVVSLLLAISLDKAYDFSIRNARLPYFTSTELQSAFAVNVEWPHEFIHIVNTRFQQEQGNLLALGRARLLLFQTFCLQSIIGQTILTKKAYQIPPFLWIIKVDPNLVPDLLKELISIVQPYNFIYVVASNNNYGIGQKVGGWRGGEAGIDVLNSKVYTGNLTFLKVAHESRKARGVLETRLDADDGLNIKYLDTIEKEASQKLLWSFNQTTLNKRRWMYWCSLHSVEWNPTPILQLEPSRDALRGVFLVKKTAHQCITAGMTIGLSLGIKENEVPRYQHDKLVEQLKYSKHKPNCGDSETNITKCLKFISDPLLGCVRSRTLTSAGMRGVGTDRKSFQQRVAASNWNNASIIANVLKVEFWTHMTNVMTVNLHLSRNRLEIASDNLKGQCTTGHSCKNSTRQTLRKVIESD